MKCTKCGSEIKEGASFCSACGMPVMNTSDSSISNNNPQIDNMNNQNGQSINQTIQPSNINGMNNQKKTPVGLIVGIIILVIIIIAGILFIGMEKEDNTKEKENNNSEVEKKEETPKKEEFEKVTYEDYTFSVPSEYSATASTSQLLIINNDNTLAEAVIFQSGTGYDTLASVKDQIIGILQSQDTSQDQNYDFTNAKTEEKTYDGTRFLITRGIAQGTTDLDIAYAETDKGVFVVSIAKTNGAITETEREDLYTIVASANQGNL